MRDVAAEGVENAEDEKDGGDGMEGGVDEQDVDVLMTTAAQEDEVCVCRECVCWKEMGEYRGIDGCMRACMREMGERARDAGGRQAVWCTTVHC